MPISRLFAIAALMPRETVSTATVRLPGGGFRLQITIMLILQSIQVNRRRRRQRWDVIVTIATIVLLSIFTTLKTHRRGAGAIVENGDQ
jgi:hypothetical protein